MFDPKDPLKLGKRLAEYTTAEYEAGLEAADKEGERKARLRDEAHEAFHGRPIRMVIVGRRPGYRGQAECHDCYYVKEWK